MPFGVIGWFVSFIIFLIVLAVIISSAVYLGKKEKRFNVLRVVFELPPQKKGYSRLKKGRKEIVVSPTIIL